MGVRHTCQSFIHGHDGRKNRGTCRLVILAHTPVIYMFTPKPPTPSKSVPHLFPLQTHLCPYKCKHVCVRMWVCVLFVLVWLCACMSGLESQISPPEKVLQQGFGVEKVSAALLICDVVPKLACNHFLLAWLYIAQ